MKLKQDVPVDMILMASLIFIVVGLLVASIDENTAQIIGAVIATMGGALLIRGIIKKLVKEVGKTDSFLARVSALPYLTKTSIFLITITILLFIFFGGSDFHKDFYYHWLKDGSSALVVVMGVIILGMVFSVYYAFSIKPISRGNKNLILFFVLFVNLFIAFTIADYAFNHPGFIPITFSILNIIIAYLSFIALVRSIKDRSVNISDKQPEKFELIIGSIIVICLFYISHYILNNFWAITFSICMVYAVSINRFIFNRSKDNENLPQV